MQNIGVECAIWPNFYPDLSYCKTSLNDPENRGTKVAFMSKVFSEISDYGMGFDLLQSHYEIWLSKTVSRAITTAQKRSCSPATSLQAKTFSRKFWRWQHCCLIDFVKQFGFPNLFITISPSEWSFPLSPWLEKLQELSGLGETNLAAFEKLHFLNTLEQIIRRYLCGSNDSKWEIHLFVTTRKSADINVLFVLIIVHLHILAWLKNTQSLNVTPITVHISWADLQSAFLVYSYQNSEKTPFPHTIIILNLKLSTDIQF